MPRIARKVKIFSALEVANICGVVNQTAINWIKNGYLKAFTTPGGQYRIYAKDLAAFLDNRGMGDSGEALQVILERANWSALLIASSDNALSNRIQEEVLKALPDFTLLQAFDGFEMGLKLAGEKPGFIIFDKDLEGVDFFKLLQKLKRDPAFCKPFVFVMTDNPESIKNDENTESGALADKIISKPPSYKNLIQAIVELEKQTEAIA